MPEGCRRATTRLQIDEAFRAAGAEPLITIEMVSIAAILELVERTELAIIVSRSAWSEHSEELRAIPLEAPAGRGGIRVYRAQRGQGYHARP